MRHFALLLNDIIRCQVGRPGPCSSDDAKLVGEMSKYWFYGTCKSCNSWVVSSRRWFPPLKRTTVHFLWSPSLTGFTVILESVLLILQMSRLTLALIEFAVFLQWNRQSCCVSVILCCLYCLCCLCWKAPQTLTSFLFWLILRCIFGRLSSSGVYLWHRESNLFSQPSLHVLSLFRFWIYR